jgi:hypothetical protein
MICKFFRGGRTYKGAKSAINYLLNDRIKNNTARVLCGNPYITLNIIKNIKNKWKFTSGVMSFEETLNNKQKQEIIEYFKQTFFPGFKDDEYNFLVVEHTDKNRTELHFMIPRIHLRSWKAYNPYWHKRDFKKKDLFQDFVNNKYNFSSPHDRPKPVKTLNLKNIPKKDELKKKIDNYLVDKINSKEIKNHDDVVKFLKSVAGCKINRVGKTYIGVEVDGRKIRLKGLIYGSSFKASDVISNTKETQKQHKKQDEIINKLKDIISGQAEVNKKKYKSKEEKETEKTIINIKTNIKKEENDDRAREQIDRIIRKGKDRERTRDERINELKFANARVTNEINRQAQYVNRDVETVGRSRAFRRFRNSVNEGIVRSFKYFWGNIGKDFLRFGREIVNKALEIIKNKKNKQNNYYNYNRNRGFGMKR